MSMPDKEYYKPGNLIRGAYWGYYDRVLEYHEHENGYMDYVVVQRCDEHGTPIEPARSHGTSVWRGDTIIEHANESWDNYIS